MVTTVSVAPRWLTLISIILVKTISVGAVYYYDPYEFQQRVNSAIQEVRNVLDRERVVQLAEEQDHTYADKFALVEQQTHSVWRTIKSVLERLGLDLNEGKTMDAHDDHRNGITLVFSGSSSCDFDKEVEVEEVGDATEVTAKGKVTTVRDIRKVKQFHWNMTASYEVYACTGVCAADGARIFLKHRTMSTTAITKAKERPMRAVEPVLKKVNITWWANQVYPNVRSFAIDRSVEDCKTPRRNKNVDLVLDFHEQLREWTQFANRFFQEMIYTPMGMETTFPFASPEKFPMPSLTPLFENSTVVSWDTLNHFFDAEKANLDQRIESLSTAFPAADSNIMFSAQEASLHLLLDYISNALRYYALGVEYVEDMLKKQLVQAIGRQITPYDFDRFMVYHGKKLFATEYAPEPFSRAVRRPNQYPVGITAIESGKSEDGPVQVFSRHLAGEGRQPIRIPIDAATSVEMSGDRYLSGWIRYQFESSTGVGQSNIVARARQFSAFVLLIGTMSGPYTFDPKHAIILQNKDELIIPLLTEVLPSAKEFKDAIASMSPEQQAFAKAFRSMQLQSSIFAVCLVQLKPQLELLLNLPDGSLAKEIKLTEDLMTLFIDYQIPSDLLSYDGPPEKSVSDKVDAVKNYVDRVLKVISDQKAEQIRQEKERDEMHRARVHATTASYAESAMPLAVPSAAPSSAPSVASHTATRNVRVNVQARALRGGDAPRVASLSADAAPDAPPVDSSPTQDQETYDHGRKAASVTDDVDFTAIPSYLDNMLEEHDTDSYLKSTILKAGPVWERKRQENLLVSPNRSFLSSSDISHEKKKAFDLLDAISRSGTLPLTSAELHVIVGMTHCFENSLIETVIRDNINPVAKAEKSALMVASTIFGVPPRELLSDGGGHLHRLSASFPDLFPQIASSREPDAIAESKSVDDDDDKDEGAKHKNEEPAQE